jgi:LAS superfamily LD-carboxypeptidase LdcB
MQRWLGFLLWLLIVLFIFIVLAWFMYRQVRNTEEIPQAPIPEQPQKSSKPQGKPKSIPPSTEPTIKGELALVSGMVQPANDPRFSQLPKSYANKIIYMQKPAAAALIKMMDAARSDGVDLQVVSGFRSYRDQLSIWQRKWDTGKGLDDTTRVTRILKFSSMPGISRHHWGTDLDFNSVELAYWKAEKGTKIQQWLRQNAPTYGFCEPYTGKSQGKRKGGYEDEPWHWSYRSTALPLQNLRSAHMNEILQQPIIGQTVIQDMPERMLAYVNAVSNSCR